MFTIDLNRPSSLPANLATVNAPDCRVGTFRDNEWGDIFARSNRMMADLNAHDPRQAGKEHLNGFETRILEATVFGTRTRVWLDTRYGLVVKLESQGRTQMEVKRLTLVKPGPAQLAPPPYCASAPQ
jgi:hypothetical protein